MLLGSLNLIGEITFMYIETVALGHPLVQTVLIYLKRL